MAEVYRAKLLNRPDFERFFAIKRILPHLAEDNEFVTMFINEAKVAVELEHPNVCQIYELGRLGQSHYIAMEYIAGRDVQAIQNYYRQHKKIMSVSQACFIIAQAAQGLDYAHRAVDSQGQPLGLIHRDVSPQNLLVTYDGVVKLIDFGVSKASRKNAHSKSGVIKGKFSYLSPEQAREDEIDHRSDIFALGIIFWELLTGRRLFQAENELTLIEAIGNCHIEKPSKYNRMIPDSVEKICMKALEKDVNKRYFSAGEMVNDLLAFVNDEKNHTPFTQWHLQNWMCSAFKDSFESEWQKIPVFNSLNTPSDIDIYISKHAEEIANSLSVPSSIEINSETISKSSDGEKSIPNVKQVNLNKEDGTSKEADKAENENDDDIELEPEGIAPTVSDPMLLKCKREEKNDRIRRVLVGFIIAICVCFIISPVLIATNVIEAPSPTPNLPTTASVTLNVIPESPDAEIVLLDCPEGNCDNANVVERGRSKGATVKFSSLPAGTYRLNATMPDYQPESFTIRLENGNYESRVEMTHAIPKETSITVNVSHEDARVYLNDMLIEGTGTTRTIKSTVGQPYLLRAIKTGYKSVSLKGTIEQTMDPLQLNLTETIPVNIHVASLPPKCQITMTTADGKSHKAETPYIFENVTTEGPVTIEVTKLGSTNSFRRTIDFKEIEDSEIRLMADIQ